MSEPGTQQSLVGSIGEIAKAGAGFFVDLLSRIAAGIQGAVLALAFGCSTQPSDAADKPAPPLPQVESKPRPVVDEGPKQLGSFQITFYYVANEEEVARAKKPANDNADAETELAAVTPPEMVTIYSKDQCEAIAEVTRDFAYQLQLQGTGKLRDGRTLNIWGNCNCERSPCFKVTRQQWGTGGSGRALTPFRTVAVDPKLIKLGSLLYVPLLEGRTMPGRPPWGGFVHDGCVVADDTGGGIKDEQLDLFVGKKAWFFGMARSGKSGSHAWARHVPVYDGSKICARKRRHVARKSGGV
jgi:3D (Asp-Asp-Asp) domain-containing protein